MKEMTVAVPTYDQLPRSPEGVALSWGVFGEGDEVGTLNHLDAECVAAGLAAARDGIVHSLNWQYDLPRPHPWRTPPQRIQRAGTEWTRDDHVEHLHLQYSTQWDGLRHVALRQGFYNGVPADQVDQAGSTTLGIDRWARRGIVGRGVLLDVAGWRAAKGAPLIPDRSDAITADDLQSTADAQHLDMRFGDIVLVRTGWIGWYDADPAHADLLTKSMCAPGLEASDRVAAWLWDHRVAAVAADNVTLECAPLEKGFPHGSLHARLLPALGMPIGELFALDELADTCRRQNSWSFTFVSAPLNVPGGVGSPANALAIT